MLCSGEYLFYHRLGTGTFNRKVLRLVGVQCSQGHWRGISTLFYGGNLLAWVLTLSGFLFYCHTHTSPHAAMRRLLQRILLNLTQHYIPSHAAWLYNRTLPSFVSVNTSHRVPWLLFTSQPLLFNKNMSSKRKGKSRVTGRSRHPSQTSIDVPARVPSTSQKEFSKEGWLCGHKAYKGFRRLGHSRSAIVIFPQAKSTRYEFK